MAGAGIVGLATAFELTRRGHSVTVLERIEPGSTSDREQLRRDSLSLHKPGNLKAKLGTAGATSMRRFAEDNTGSLSRSAASSWWRPTPYSCRRFRSSSDEAGQRRPRVG